MDNATLVRINRHIQSMPPLSVTVTKIMELSKDPSVDAKKLNDVISIDPVLTGKVLKLINSAYYSMPNQVTSLVHAVVMLGVNTIKNLVISTGVMTNMSKGNNFSALDMEFFWRHSLAVGALAKYLAGKQKIDPKLLEEYFVAGLLHDIGKIPFNTVIEEKYRQAIELSKERNQPLHKIESDFFEINHCDLGLRIAEIWKLPPNLRDIIIYHHHAEEADAETKKFVATVALANIIAKHLNIGFSGNSVADTSVDQLLTIIGLTENDLNEAEKSAEATVKKAEIFLNIG